MLSIETPYQYLAYVLMVTAVIVSVATVVGIVRGTAVTHVPLQRVMVSIQLVNIFQQGLSFYSYYLSSEPDYARSIWVCVIYTAFGQMHLNCLVLRIFSSLSKGFITERGIHYARIVILSLYGLLSLPILLAIVLNTDPRSELSRSAQYTSLAVIGSSVLLDDILAFYLIYLVYKTHKRKDDPETERTLIMVIVFNLSLVLLDWTGITVQLYGTMFLSGIYSDVSSQIASALSSLRAAGSISVFLHLKKLTFAGSGLLPQGMSLATRVKSLRKQVIKTIWKAEEPSLTPVEYPPQVHPLMVKDPNKPGVFW
ncbi:hypothetical protein HDU91_000434 [Kappamyces sp. JEL0680]|nr:hypothetical protein HDU91_000434 [Kappamyces sp. JEL0680]